MIFYGIIYFIMFANIFDMGGAVGIKYLSYATTGLFVLYHYRNFTLRLEEIWVSFLLFVIVPAWALFNGLAHGGLLSEASSQVTPFLPGILMLLLLSKGGYDYALKVFFQVMAALAVVVIVLFFLLLLIPDHVVSRALLDYLKQPGHGLFGVRGLAGIRLPNVYFKATLYFVPCFIYYLYLGKPWYAFLFLVALVLAFSKAGILLCLVFLGAYILTHGGRKAKWAAIILTLATAYLLMTWSDAKFIGGYIDYMINTVSGRAETTQIRVGHWTSFIDLMKENPQYLIWGQGVGTAYFSLGRGRPVYNIELDHVDATRQFGLIWFIAFSLIVLYIALRLMKSKKDNHTALGISFLGIYLAAGTNPVLITPLFMMLLAALYMKMKFDTAPILGVKTLIPAT